jgi:hypothetical protein
MDEQDYKYLIATYQQKSFELLSQLVVAEAKIKKLTELVETLNNQQEMSTKPKRNNQKEDFS